MSLPYFKHTPQDYLHDARILKLTYEERGIYWQLINEMWISQMQLPDDDEYLSLLLRIDLTRWLEIKKKLLIGKKAPLMEIQAGNLVSNDYQAKHERANDYCTAQALKRAKKRLNNVAKFKGSRSNENHM